MNGRICVFNILADQKGAFTAFIYHFVMKVHHRAVNNTFPCLHSVLSMYGKCLWQVIYLTTSPHRPWTVYPLVFSCFFICINNSACLATEGKQGSLYNGRYIQEGWISWLFLAISRQVVLLHRKGSLIQPTNSTCLIKEKHSFFITLIHIQHARTVLRLWAFLRTKKVFKKKCQSISLGLNLQLNACKSVLL